MTVEILLNGQRIAIPDGTTVAALVERMGLRGVAAAAEVNKILVPKREHATRTLEQDDELEVVSLVGGG
jgi:sulfur carrier protein